MFVFGSIFGGDNSVSFRIGLLNNAQTDFAKEFASQIQGNEIFEVDEEVVSEEQAKEKMNRGQLDATIVLPADFGEIRTDAGYPAGQAKVLYAQSNETAGQTLTAIMDGIFKEINTELVPSQTPFSVQSESTATAGLTPFDYTFSGILGFTLLSLVSLDLRLFFLV